MNREEFLKTFSKTSTAQELLDSVLTPLLEEIRDVTNTNGIRKDYSTNGEIFVGKKIAATVIEQLIQDIEHYEKREDKKVDPRDRF